MAVFLTRPNISFSVQVPPFNMSRKLNLVVFPYIYDISLPEAG
jgi:hypothetical protein